MKKLALVYINAGGGHRAAAMALAAVIRERALPWNVKLVDLFEVLDPRGIFRKATGLKPEQYYNGRLARGWTLGLAQELKVLQALIRVSHKTLTTHLTQFWRDTEPDLVVSVVPNFNRALYHALSIAQPHSPYVTLLTDLADSPPHFWIEARPGPHLICGTDRAVRQARAAGHAASQIHRTSGMVIGPDFYRWPPIDRRAERRRLELDADLPTGIVSFGAHGSKVMRRIAKDLGDTQLILICGHNAELADQLRATPAKAPRVIVGFSSQIPYFMRLADFFIGKPGPGSLSEAIQRGLPVIVVRNAWTMPQERYNADWVLEQHAGMVLDSFSRIRGAVAALVEQLDGYRASVAGIRNRAVFEIPDILERLLTLSDAGLDRRRYPSASPDRRVLASDSVSILGAAERSVTAPLRSSAQDLAERQPKRPHQPA
jgi:Glycosyltransferase family 28 C-terminal domain